MRVAWVAAAAIVSGSSLGFVRWRAAPRELAVSAVVRDGSLLVRGRLDAPALPFLRRETRLYSTAPDGDLAIRRIVARDAAGREVGSTQRAAATHATCIALASDAT